MIPLRQEKYYHVYNRANGFEKIFINDGNYQYFLKKYQIYISPFVTTYCYCLMPNHFHLLVSIKSETEILQVLAQDEKTFPKFKTLENLVGEQNPNRNSYLEKLISKQFSNFFSCYTQSFNKQQKRMGSLFMKNFKRKEINNISYLRNLIKYIHNNPVDANLSATPNKWEFSSYNDICKLNNNLVEANTVIEWFNDLENFKYFHSFEVIEDNYFL